MVKNRFILAKKTVIAIVKKTAILALALDAAFFQV